MRHLISDTETVDKETDGELCISPTPVAAHLRLGQKRSVVSDKNFGVLGFKGDKKKGCERRHLLMRTPIPQVSSSSPEPGPGLMRTHTLTFVWAASKLPRRLIKGAKEMKESIKVTLFLQPAHTQTHTH